MWKSVLLMAGLALAATPLAASDGIVTTGRLSDRDFYRLATCGAAPGQACQGPQVRWAKRKVTVGVGSIQRGYPPALAQKVVAALDHAIAEINGANAGLRLQRNDDLAEPDIIVTLATLSEGDRTRNIPRMPDGEEIGVGFMRLEWNAEAEITAASILIAKDITDEDLPSVMLEELFQTLGFLYDIENPYYEGRSILSQDSNETITIRGQDRKALRQLYP
jgi:hypothetical protein